MRFIDNFSAGTRGACSAEYFIENGYAVIFFHRKFSLLPYARHYSHTTNCFLDFMVERDDRVEGTATLVSRMLITSQSTVYEEYVAYPTEVSTGSLMIGLCLISG